MYNMASSHAKPRLFILYWMQKRYRFQCPTDPSKHVNGPSKHARTLFSNSSMSSTPFLSANLIRMRSQKPRTFSSSVSSPKRSRSSSSSCNKFITVNYKTKTSRVTKPQTGIKSHSRLHRQRQEQPLGRQQV
jgi:hypothetical protein